MDLFDQIEKIANDLSEAARRIILAELQSKKLGIPGKAAWNGYNANGQATVIKNNKVINVNTTSTIVLPIGTQVYVDETFTVEYKTNKPKKEEPTNTPKEAKSKKRVKKARRPILPGPDVVENVRGATWLVYHEYLTELEWTTAAETGTNPPGINWSLFLSLLPLVFLGGGVLFGAIYWTLMEYHVENLPSITISDLPTPDNHPDFEADDDVSRDDFNYFFLLQAVVDQIFTSAGLLAFPPLQSDGFWLGKNTAIGNYILFIGQDNQSSYPGTITPGGGLTFSDKYFIRPWAYNLTDRLAGLLIHYGPGKIQAALYRVVGVYPSKKFKVNINSWPVPDFEIAEYNPDWTAEQIAQWRAGLPAMRHKQFVIPDDISEWNQILGGGTLDPDNEVGDLIPYEIIPLHDYQTYGDENEPYDLTKFASYSENNLFLNYIVKSYAPWTELDDTFRINYHLLTLRATNSPDDESMSISYKFTPSTFNLPEEFKVFGDIVAEDPNFPLQAGEKNVAERKITFTIRGTNDPVIAPQAVVITAVRGTPEKRGFLPGADPDSGTAYIEDDNGVINYNPEKHLTFAVEAPPAGFVYNQYTGEYIFNQNNSAYVQYQSGQSIDFIVEYSVTDKFGTQAYNTITILLQGANSSFVEEDPGPPFAKALDSSDLEDDPAPTQEWDPEPYIESIETGETQVFEKTEVEIPFPEVDDNNNVLGWQGRVSRVELKEVDPPEIRYKTVGGKSIKTSIIQPSDFIFSATTDAVKVGGAATKFLVDFTPKPKNYDFLGEGDEIQVTYTLKGLVNNAPFVGNFEDVSDFQKKKVLSDAIQFAYSDDWRSKIFNPREAPTFNNIFVFPVGDSITRDSNIPLINIDQVTRAVSSNFIYEFEMWDANESEPDFNASFGNEGRVYITRNLIYDFDEEAEELLFYASDDVTQSNPLDWDSVLGALQSTEGVLKTDYFVDAMLPYGLNRNDETGNSWRWNRDRSAKTKGYLIFGFIPLV